MCDQGSYDRRGINWGRLAERILATVVNAAIVGIALLLYRVLL